MKAGITYAKANNMQHNMMDKIENYFLKLFDSQSVLIP